MDKPCVLLADDHRIVLEGLRSLLQSEYVIVGEVEDGRSLVAEAERLRPELVEADISMPKQNGIDAARQIKQIDACIRIVFLLAERHPSMVMGVRGLLAGEAYAILCRFEGQ